MQSDHVLTMMDFVTIVLSLVALMVTVIGFFASLRFYRDGNEAFLRAQAVLSKIEERTVSISTHVGGMFSKTLDAVLGQAHPNKAREDQSRVMASLSRDEAREQADTPSSPSSISEQQAKTVMEYFAFQKLRYSDVSNEDARAIFLLGADHGFNLFNGIPGIVFFGYFEDLAPAAIVARVRFLLQNIESSYARIDKAEVPNAAEALKLLNSMRIEVLIPGDAPADAMRTKLEDYQPEGRPVPVTLLTSSDLESSVGAQYREMGF